MTIEFEQRAVAFIDILGFKQLVAEAESSDHGLEKFREITSLLDESVKELDKAVDEEIPKKLIPKHLSISDSIVLSAPMAPDEHPWYDGLSIVVMRCIQLTHIFLKKGYLLRGGISVGLACHRPQNIYGTAYQQAYKLEATIDVPCIALCSNARKLWPTKYTNMCIDEGNYYRVNGLHDWYIREKHEHGGIERVYKEYQAIVNENILKAPTCSVWEKWKKFDEYLQKEMPTVLAFAKANQV